MKKLFFTVLAICIAATAFAGGETDARSSAPVEIEFWTTETQSERLATIGVLVDTFQTLNPEITIKVIPVDENDMSTQMNAAAAAGTLPALIESATQNTVAFGSQGMLNTNAATEIVNEIGKDKFYEGVLKLNQTNNADSYYSIPYHGWVQGIWYRADWFEQAGLNPPETWEDILAAAREFYNPAQNQYGILVGTMAETYAEQCFTQFAMSNGAGLFDSSGNLIFN